MNNKNKHFPMFVDISQKHILVVGAGKIALRRIKTLLEFNEHITVVAPEMEPEIEKLPVELKKKKFEIEDLKHQQMVIIATNDKALNASIAQICTHKEIIKNVISDKSLCDFYFPGIVQKEEIVIGITTGGDSPAKAKKTRQRIEKYLSEDDF